MSKLLIFHEPKLLIVPNDDGVTPLLLAFQLDKMEFLDKYFQQPRAMIQNDLLQNMNPKKWEAALTDNYGRNGNHPYFSSKYSLSLGNFQNPKIANQHCYQLLKKIQTGSRTTFNEM
jgi:hypothetical protein